MYGDIHFRSEYGEGMTGFCDRGVWYARLYGQRRYVCSLQWHHVYTHRHACLATGSAMPSDRVLQDLGLEVEAVSACIG